MQFEFPLWVHMQPTRVNLSGDIYNPSTQTNTWSLGNLNLLTPWPKLAALYPSHDLAGKKKGSSHDGEDQIWDEQRVSQLSDERG